MEVEVNRIFQFDKVTFLAIGYGCIHPYKIDSWYCVSTVENLKM